MDQIMPVYLGTPCSILLVEADDGNAARDTATLQRFPGNVVYRVKTKRAALARLDHGPHRIDQVCLDGRVWTIQQALPLIRAMPDALPQSASLISPSDC